MTTRNEISTNELCERTTRALAAEWERWASTLPADATSWPRAAAYVRESSPDSLVGDAPVVQLQNTLNMLAAQRKYVEAGHVFFENVSGTEYAARAEFQRVIALALAGEFSVIGAYMSNRFFRNAEESNQIKRRLRLSGIQLTWVGKPELDERHPMTWQSERTLDTADEWHSRQTGYLVGQAMEFKTRKGEPLGRLPECWRIIERAPGVRSGHLDRPIKWELAEPMASIVRQGAKKYLKGMTYRQLGLWSMKTELNGITPAGKHMDWIWWRNLLVNPKIAGYQAPSRYTGYKPGKESPQRPSLKERENELVPCLLPPLITLAEYRRILATSRARKGERKVRARYHEEVISTIAYDIRCGHRLHIKARAKTDREDFVLRCKEMTAAGYHMPTYRGLDAQNELDRLVGQVCLDDPELPRRVADELAALLTEKRDEARLTRARTDPRAAELRTAIASLTDARFDGLCLQLQEELAAIEEQATPPPVAERVLRYQAAIDDLKRWPAIWAKADKRQKNSMLRAAGVKVWVEPVPNPNPKRRQARPYSRLVAVETDVPEFSLALATALRGALKPERPAIQLDALRKRCVGLVLLDGELRERFSRAQAALRRAA